MSGKHHRPTQSDIAAAAGVSPAVVSLVINDRANGTVKISRETQERVQQAIRELGYVPNLAARQLAGGRTRLIGVFTYDPIFPIEPTNFYQPFLVGIEDAASKLDYNLLLYTRSGASGIRRIYQDGINQLLATEGAILLGAFEDRSELARLMDDKFPFAFVGRREINGVSIPASSADYATATHALVTSLIDAGHREIALLSNECRNESAVDRESGFRSAMAAIGITDITRLTEVVDTSTITPEWLIDQLRKGRTAFAVGSTSVAERLLQVARATNLTVPGDISIVALGNADDPTLSQHTIDSFTIPHREMGAAAVALLDHMLSQPSTPISNPPPITCLPAPGSTVGSPKPTHRYRKEETFA